MNAHGEDSRGVSPGQRAPCLFRILLRAEPKRTVVQRVELLPQHVSSQCCGERSRQTPERQATFLASIARVPGLAAAADPARSLRQCRTVLSPFERRPPETTR